MQKFRGGANFERSTARRAPPPEALHKAFEAYSGGRLAEGEKLCRAVTASRPDLFDAWHLLGVIQAAAGKSDHALRSYDRALALHREAPEALTNRGAVLHNLGRFAQALESYDAALAQRPDLVHALTNRGITLHAMKRFAEALASYERALGFQPRNAEAFARRGVVLHELSRFQEALASFDRALTLRPADPETLYNRGNSLGQLHRLEEALASYDRALALRPDYAEAIANRGAALFELKRYDQALTSFDRVLATRPADPETLYKRGAVLHELKRHTEALSSFDRALAIRPGDADALYNRGNTLVSLKRFGPALADFDRTLAIRPDHPHAFGAAANCAIQLCEWERRAQFLVEMRAQVEKRKSIISPFTLLAFSDDPSLQLQCARNYVAKMIPSPPQPLWAGGPSRGEKLRVAYLSADYRKHAVAHLIAELIERHDRSRFEIVGISFGPDDGSEMRGRLARAFDTFRDVRGLSNQDAAKLIHSMQVDIAVDLTGFTRDSRSEILAFRPAPIQVNYLGFPATMGADFVDYILVDRKVAPLEHQSFFSEKIVRLPDCYQVNDSKRAISAQSPTRTQAGLPEHAFVFCCFNNVWKITPEMFDLWMRLLNQVEESVLWLLASHEGAEQNLCRQAQAHGVDPARLVFASPLPLEDHLARHRLADLFLDTLPYNAHTTASDALWAGLPLVTCKGAAFAGRVAASLLEAIDLPELVTKDLKAYEALALRLARDPGALRDLRDRLERNRATKPLFDTDRFRRHIERAYLEMWEFWQRGDVPRSFDVISE